MSDEQTNSPPPAVTDETQAHGVAAYAFPDLEPTSDEERLRRKNPLGYSITAPTEEEIEEGETETPAFDS